MKKTRAALTAKVACFVFILFLALMVLSCGGGGGGGNNPTTPPTTTTTPQTVSATNTTGTTSIASATVKYDSDALPSPPTITFEASSSSSVPTITSSTFDIKQADTVVKIESSQQPSKPVTIELAYKDDDNDGVVDGTNISVDKLIPLFYDDSLKAWVTVALHGEAVVDKTNKKITVTTSHFSKWSPAELKVKSNTSTLTYRVRDYPSGPNSTDVDAAIKNAIGTWDNLLPNISYKEDATASFPNLAFEWNCESQNVICNALRLAHCPQSSDQISSKDIAFTYCLLGANGLCRVEFCGTPVQWQVVSQGSPNTTTTYDIQNIATHEIGHTWLGPSHLGSSNQPPIMMAKPQSTVFNDLWSDDYDWLAKSETTQKPTSISITASPNTSAFVGQNYQSGITVANIKGGIRPYAWTVTGLPSDIKAYVPPNAAESKESTTFYLNKDNDLISGIPQKPGTYNVELKVTDYYTGSGTLKFTLSVKCSDGTIPSTGSCDNQSPTASISAPLNNASYTQGQSITFTGSGTDTEDGTLSGSSLVWTSSKDGQIGTGTSFSTSSLSVNTHTITLTATDSKGATGTATPITITVSSAPQATLSSISVSCASTSLTVGQTTQCTATGTYSDNSSANLSSSATWSSSSASVGTISPSGVFTAVSAGAANITATKDGKTSNAVTITVNAAPTATLTSDTSSGPAPLNVTFTVAYTDPEGKSGTYSLNFGDSTTAATGSINSGVTTTVSHSYSSTGTYSAMLTVTDDKGATGTNATGIVVTASPQNKNPVIASGPTASSSSITTGSTTTISVTASDPDGDALSYSWSANGGTVSGSGSSVTYTAPSSTGTYTITVTISDGKGGSASGSVSVTVTSSGGGTKTVTQIAAGYGHTCALTSSGGVKCWGSNGSGQLGNNSTANSLTPVDVSGLTSGVSTISAGHSYTCALLSSGSVKCWGDNSIGQLGNNSTINSSIPVDVYGLTSGVSSISAGWSHTCALISGGVKCWGSNGSGQLGNNSTISSSIPVDVSGLTSGVIAITAGGSHTCALLSSGSVKCWGYNFYGQLGNNSTTNSSIPVPVSGLTNSVSSVSAGYEHTCALTTSNSVQCWGYNTFGQLGNNSTVDSSIPVPVSGLTSGVSFISAGADHTCAVLSTGGVQCWGWNGWGQLGNNSTVDSSIPVPVSGLTNGVSFISTGVYHTCAVLSTGGVQCWGWNGWGQLGNGTTIDSSIPVPVDSSLYALSPLQRIKHYFLAFADTIKCTFSKAWWN